MTRTALIWVLLPLGGALLGAAAVAPELVHARDRASASVTFDELLAGGGTRNVSLEALADFDSGLRQTVTRKDSQTSPDISFFLPVRPVGSDPAAPTRLVVQVRDNTIFDAAERPNEPIHIRGMVRDVLWEGLDGKVRESLEALHPLAPDVKLVEQNAHPNPLAAYGGPLLGLVIGLFAASNLARQKRLDGAPTPSGEAGA